MACLAPVRVRASRVSGVYPSRPIAGVVIFAMKKCKTCNAGLSRIGKIEPDTLWLSTKRPSLSPFAGIGYFAVFLLGGLLIAQPLWESHLIWAGLIVAVCGGLGAYLWKRPRNYYRCTQCGSEFYDDIVLRRKTGSGCSCR